MGWWYGIGIDGWGDSMLMRGVGVQPRLSSARLPLVFRLLFRLLDSSSIVSRPITSLCSPS